MIKASVTALKCKFVALCLTAVACAPSGQGNGLAGGDICEEISSQANSAFRDNFLTEYDKAERAWTNLFALYETRAEEIAECPNVPSRSVVLANLGLVYSNQRNFTAATGMLKASAEAGSSQSKIYEALHQLNRSAVGETVLESAETVSVSVDASRGLSLLERDLNTSVLEISAQAQRGLIEEGVNLAALSFAYLSRNRLDEALKSVDGALRRVRPVRGASSSYAPRFKVTKAEVLLARGETDRALSTIRDAINSYGADMQASALMARAEVVLGRILSASGDTEEALAAYKRGFEILKRVSVRVSYDLLWPYVSEVQKAIAASPSRRAELTDDLFSAAQAVRSDVTASSVSLAASSAAEGSGELAAAVREANAASEELALIVSQKLLVESQTALVGPEATRQVGELFEKARAREQAAIERVLALDPEYFERLGGTARIEGVQQSLQEDEAFVQIVLGAPESLVFVIRKNSFQMATTSKLSQAQVTQIVASIREITRLQLIYTPNESYKIYEAFIEPFERDLEGADKLIFSLSDALTVIPMEILATRKSQIDDLQRLFDFSDVVWMADKYDISYVPSPRNLIDLRAAAKRGVEPRPIIAFGDFQPGAEVDRILAESFLPRECEPIAQAISQLPPLAGTLDEVNTVGEIFGEQQSVLVAGADFTEQRITDESDSGTLKQYGILHFATHGILPTGDCIRRPALSVSADGVTDSDGLLTDVEIRRLSLDADLVVLSACDTAGSITTDFNASGGEALSGLARAFFDAGTRALLATHWPVSDDITAQMIKTFYTELKNGRTMQAALRTAQRQVRSNPDTSDPIFWGAFIIAGDASRTLTIR
ncbi:MAG: CHAT domain-containing protein [Pseudomonadota bacterium]